MSRQLLSMAGLLIVLTSCGDGGLTLRWDILPDFGFAGDIYMDDSWSPDRDGFGRGNGNGDGNGDVLELLDRTGEDVKAETTDPPRDVKTDGPPVKGPLDPCSPAEPCAGGLTCLLLPEATDGICLFPCHPDGILCHPDQECVTPDLAQPDYRVCMTRKSALDPCQPTQGDICPEGQYCIEEFPGRRGLCTQFCAMGQTLCAGGTVCRVIDPLDPNPAWGACLPMLELQECQADGDCGWGKRCVWVGDSSSRCVAVCTQNGQCEDRMTCNALLSPTSGDVRGCIEVAADGQRCAAERGIVCRADLDCVPESPDGLLGRCAAPCVAGSCPPGKLCRPDDPFIPAGAGHCLDPVFVLPARTGCSADFPCTGTEEVCVVPVGGKAGICLTDCSHGCGPPDTCMQGGCIRESAAGESCFEKGGLVCEPQLTCLRDHAMDVAGLCSKPCGGGSPLCAAPANCVGTPHGEYCLRQASFGQLCSLDDGWGCNPDTQCIHMGNQEDWGMCTSPCTPGGACPDLAAMCVLKKGSSWFCGYLCDESTPCPAPLSCGSGVLCTP